MLANCRRAPIGIKTARLDQGPDPATQLELVNIVAYAAQDQAWRDTTVTISATCPGLKRGINSTLKDGVATIFPNAAGVKIGKFKGTATFGWPNGQTKTVNWFYEIIA